MTTEKMTIHKALSELKIIGDRIQSGIQTSNFIVPNKHSNEKINGIPVSDFKEQIKANWNKVTDLIKRRNAIKKAVTLSNATTKVKVGNDEYSVAEAIEMKNTGIQYQSLLLETIRRQYASSANKCNSENGDTLSQRAEQYAIGLYGSKDGKTTSDDIEKTKKEFIKMNTFELVDPINVASKIETLEKELSDFASDVDSILSTSNAITEIEINY
jgi:hypothetical protein